MTHYDLSKDCRAASGALLAALDANDISGIASLLGLMRGLLQQRAGLPSAGLSGSELFECERLEAIDAVTERIEEGLRTLHQTVHAELEEIQSLKPLLRHLASPACSSSGQPGAGLTVH